MGRARREIDFGKLTNGVFDWIRERAETPTIIAQADR
jgi:hypothetical protein